MYQWRDMMADGGGAVALPRGFAPFAPRLKQRVRFSLLVDLAAEPLSATWWRGAATLTLLCATAGMLAPKFEPLRGASIERPNELEAREYREIGVTPLGVGASSGGRMVATDRVQPLLVAPERTQIDLEARLTEGDRIEALLMRVGAVPREAMAVGRMVHAAAPRGLDGGTSIAIRLGARDGGGQRMVSGSRFVPDWTPTLRSNAGRPALPRAPRASLSTSARAASAAASATVSIGRCAPRGFRRWRRAII